MQGTVGKHCKSLWTGSCRQVPCRPPGAFDMLNRMSCRIALAALAIPLLTGAQEWPSYGGDPGGMKYSPLKQIDKTNVERLRPAWIFHTGDVSDGTRWPTRSAFESTPLVVDGVMYVTTPFSRVIALDAET